MAKMSPKMKDYTQSLFGPDRAETVSADAQVIRVAFDSGADTCFDYAIPPHMGSVEMGCRVEVPLGRANKPTVGFCVEVLDRAEAQKSRQFRLKTVRRVIDDAPLLNEQLMDLARWISRYYVCPLGQTLAAMVPAAVKKGIGIKTEKLIYLARPGDGDIEGVTGKKQRRIIEILQQGRVHNADNAIARAVLLKQAQCTEAPLKNLLRRRFVVVVSRRVMAAPPAVPRGLRLETEKIILNEDQQRAIEHIGGKLRANQFGVTLLHGVTDSGKTEIYIRIIEQVVAQGKTAIVLLPEIALTTQTVTRFARRFKRIAVMHCRLTAAQRHEQWRIIRDGAADVVIGARSAVFAPLANLGLIVIDEEHESGYKQDTAPRYHGRDAAIKRAQLAGAHCILGSATPSLESLSNCRTKEHFQLIELPKRVMNLPMPEMSIVDMTYQAGAASGANLISTELETQIRQRLQRKEQVILLLNRRGYSNFVFCPRCHHCLQCRNCDVTLTFHKKASVRPGPDTVLGKPIKDGYAICHYCLSKTLVRRLCSLCGGVMAMIGIGSQRLEEELQTKLPKARTMRIDSDTMRGASVDKYYRILDDFAQGRIDILAGTQMLAKGLHFPNVTLVGIISADTSLAIPDFRSNERTFQLICQVAGRAGRSEKKGRVILQTFLPGHRAIRFAMRHDYAGFTEAELEHRKSCNLPPFWRMAIIHIQHEKFDRLEAACTQMADRVNDIVQRDGLDIKVRGPMPAAIARMHGRHRMQIILQSPEARIIEHFFSRLRACPPLRPAVKVAIDMDPINLL